MKSLSATLLFGIWLFCCSGVLAQHVKNNDRIEGTVDINTKSTRIYPNSLKLQFGDFYIRERGHMGGPITQLGLCYERKLYKGFHAGIGYTQWTKIFGPSPWIVVHEPVEWGRTPVIGELEAIRNYKMLDFYVFQKFRLGGNNHFLNAGLGVSYNWGENMYLVSYYGYFFEPHSISEWRKVAYYGVTPSISYDCLLYNGRFSIGADIRGRYYSGRARAEYDYGGHIGVNF